VRPWEHGHLTVEQWDNGRRWIDAAIEQEKHLQGQLQQADG